MEGQHKFQPSEDREMMHETEDQEEEQHMIQKPPAKMKSKQF
jgi:hypothetical protein